MEEERSIPGMVEPIESKLLYKLANSLNFKEGDSVVEFGTFLEEARTLFVKV